MCKKSLLVFSKKLPTETLNNSKKYECMQYDRYVYCMPGLDIVYSCKLVICYYNEIKEIEL